MRFYCKDDDRYETDEEITAIEQDVAQAGMAADYAVATDLATECIVIVSKQGRLTEAGERYYM